MFTLYCKLLRRLEKVLLFLSIVGIFVLTLPATAQDNFPVLMFKGEEMTALIPSDWTMVASANGDLNKDSNEDFAFVLEREIAHNTTDSVEVAHGNVQRILAVYLKNKNGSYGKIVQSNTFILSRESDTMKDPFDGVRINDGRLEIYFEIWDENAISQVSNYLYSFQLTKGNMELVNFYQNDANRDTGENIDYRLDFLDKKFEMESYNYNTGEQKEVVKRRMKIDRLRTINLLGKPFQWSFMGIYI